MEVMEYGGENNLFSKIYLNGTIVVTILANFFFSMLMLGITCYLYYIIFYLQPANYVYILYFISIFPLLVAFLPIIFVVGIIFVTIQRVKGNDQTLYILTDRRFIAYFQDHQIYMRTRSPSYEVSYIDNPPCLYYSDLLITVPGDKLNETFERLRSWNQNFN